MRAALIRARSAAVALACAAPLAAQGTEPLRNSDLVRLLSAGTMSTAEIGTLIDRNCVSFTPTARDREKLLALGADSALLQRIDRCLRARSVAKPATPRPAPAPRGLVAVPLTTRVTATAGTTASVAVALKRGDQAIAGRSLVLRGSGRTAGGSAADAQAVTDARGIAVFQFAVGTVPGTRRLSIAVVSGEALASAGAVDLTVVPPAAPAPPPVTIKHPAPDRTGFVSGTGQRGAVGETAPLPLVFEARDSAGLPVVGLAVQFAVTNGQASSERVQTDSLGQARVRVTFGTRTNVPTVVTATAPPIVRQGTVFPQPGPLASLVVLQSGIEVTHQVVVEPEGPTVVNVQGRDGYGNPVMVSAVVASSGEERIVRVTAVTADSSGGWVTLRPGRQGSTNLMVQSAGVRTSLTAVVRPR